VSRKARKAKPKKAQRKRVTVKQQLEIALRQTARVGRPTEYKEVFSEQAKKLCELGAIDTEVAGFFNVDVRTLYRWQLNHPEFRQALKAGKSAADDRVEKALYRRATGYSHDAVKIFVNKEGEVTKVDYVEQYPPDTTAGIFWLKNRRREEWRDKYDHEHKGKVTALVAADKHDQKL